MTCESAAITPVEAEKKAAILARRSPDRRFLPVVTACDSRRAVLRLHDRRCGTVHDIQGSLTKIAECAGGSDDFLSATLRELAACGYVMIEGNA